MTFDDNCSKCNISDCTIKKCLPKGTSEEVFIYFVGEAPGPEENKEGIPFIGRAGKYFHEIISSFGLNESNCRFFNVVRCYPAKDDNTKGFRASRQSEIDSCKGNVLGDIIETNPNVIVTLGNTASKSLLENSFTTITKCRGEIYDCELEHNGIIKKFKVIPTYHPSYLIRNEQNSKIRVEFKTDIKTAMNVALDPEYKRKDKLKDSESETIQCKSFKEFMSFCSKYIDNNDEIAYDIETNAKEVHSEDYEVVGFSLASNKQYGCYVPLSSLDFTMPSNDKRLIEKKLSSILQSKTVYVYNCQHELPATLNWLGIEIPNVEDIFVMVKLMMGNADQYQGNGGLKAQSVMHLNHKDWSKDLDEYFTLLREYSGDTIYAQPRMRELLSNYYEGEELDKIIDLVSEIASNTKKSEKVISYGKVPCNLISRYGSIDSSVLFELLDFYNNWMDKEGAELGIDLHKGYRYWMKHHLAGYVLEKNGAYWNDEKAKEIEEWCNQGMDKCIRELVLSPLSEPFLRNSLRNEFYIYLKDNYLDKILPEGMQPVRVYKASINVRATLPENVELLKSMSIYPNDKGVGKLQMGNLEYLSRDFLKQNPDLYDNWYNNYTKQLFTEDTSREVYKSYLNPNATSTEFKRFISEILITYEIRYAKFMRLLINIVEDPSYDPTMFRGENDIRVMGLIDKLRISDAPESKKFEIFMKYLQSHGVEFNSRKLSYEFRKAMNYTLETLDAGALNEIYELYLMCGIDVEDSSTWNEEFRWLFNYKMFKKFSKILSTYINGKVGRNNVYYVDKRSYTGGDNFTRRGKLYKEYNGDTSDKVMMLQQDFKINMADTGRWQSGIHNLPAGETIKGIYTSRFPGGTIMMPDGSQMEVRTLAAECQDENLLKAFKDGVDIHRFFASKIYSVPYDEVLDWQRGLAKNAVFGLLYGESEKAFADSYLHGDLSGAKKIFSDMFNGFPRIREYVEKAHNQYETHNKVTTMTQRYINLNDPRVDHNSMLRRSQNYPIQASAEDIAGIILYELCDYLRKNNFKSKPFCFIHDSIEIDVHPSELFPLIDQINYLFNEFPLKEFGVPVACDVPLGPSMGQEIEVVSMKHNDSYDNIDLVLSGYEDDIMEMKAIWDTVYRSVDTDLDFDSGEPKKVYVPYGKTFLPKKAPVSMKMGQTRIKTKKRFLIKI